MTRAVPQNAPIPVLTSRTIPGPLTSPHIRQKITSTEDPVLRASNGPNRRDRSSTERRLRIAGDHPCGPRIVTNCLFDRNAADSVRP